MKFLSPNGQIKFCFLFGSKIKNSPSPAMHSNWFQRHNLNMIYLPCQIQEEKTFKNTVSNLLHVDNFHGGNITMPFKNMVVEALNIELSPSVLSTGVANTLYKNKNQEWCLENTDIAGIAKTIESLIPQNAPYNLVVLGGGGTAASCIYYGEELDSRCQKILCLTRSPAKTNIRFPLLQKNKKLQLMDFHFDNINEIKKITSNKEIFVLVINTIPAENSPENQTNNLLHQLAKMIPINQICYFDVVYERTPNMEVARQLKMKCLDGSIMLETQAKESFYLWTSIRL